MTTTHRLAILMPQNSPNAFNGAFMDVSHFVAQILRIFVRCGIYVSIDNAWPQFCHIEI
jgi:hypothetical protein